MMDWLLFSEPLRLSGHPPFLVGVNQTTEVVMTRVPLQATGSDVPLVPIADALKLAAGKTIID
jgi:hypothetical protein